MNEKLAVKGLWMALAGAAGILLQFGLDLAMVRPRPPYDPVEWFMDLESLAHAVAVIWIALVALGLGVFLVDWLRPRSKCGVPSEPHIFRGDAAQREDAPTGLTDESETPWPALDRGIGAESKFEKALSSIHAVLRWMTGSNVWLSVVLISLLILYFVFWMVFIEGVALINEWKSE